MRRATWVDRNRSVAPWKLPTLSAREWRSAAEAALGANGSCTCTKSSSVRSRKSSSVRDTSSGSATDPPRRNGRLCPTATSDAQPGSANTASWSRLCSSIRARPSRTSSRESEGATTTTLCPREHSSSESRSTKRLTSWCCSHGYGVTCAMRSRSEATSRRIRAGEAARRAARGPPVVRLQLRAAARYEVGSTLMRASPPGSFGAPQYCAMKRSVLSCATESGTCTGGDFIR